ncbi:MAG TPA: efflux RND transporter periplasmic adaptor subunit [Candidatus Acidoferrales bacterium]|nr:efflux RND transporter periplasmic adaptor subunit [Candidatus Acidoferrales bacterium]
MIRNYRKPFVLALIGNIIFIGVLARIWWTARRSSTSQAPAVSAPSNATQPSQGSSSGSAPPPTETPLAPVQLSAERLQSIGVKFGLVERKPVQDEIRATGTVVIDETRLSFVQTRISGHIEKVFADATYQYVRKGQRLFTIHSPELIVAEREYLLAKQNANSLSQSTVPGVAAGAASLLDSSRERFEQWDIPAQEISRLESTGQVVDALEIDSPVSGYITERNALPNLNVQTETRLYTIADLSTVWVLAQIFQNDLGRIGVGAPTLLTVDSYPGRSFRGKVDFIYPDVDMTTRTTGVRLVFSNPNLTLTPGMYVNVVLHVSLGNQLVIPVSGVLQSGTRQIVFVDRGSGYLEPRDVQLGIQAGDQYIVLKGLKAGEHIVTSANFLVDSESQLQAAIGSFAPPPPGAGAAAAMNTPTAQSAAQIDFSAEPSTPRKGTNLYRVKLAATDGTPVTGAQVSVRSYMPAMPQMGMAAINVVTLLSEKSGGIYEGQVNLESSGTWQLTVTATKNGSAVATKQLSVNAEGGM